MYRDTHLGIVYNSKEKKMLIQFHRKLAKMPLHSHHGYFIYLANVQCMSCDTRCDEY